MNRSSHHGFADLVDAVRERFALLHAVGYAEPSLSITVRECHLVYTCEGRATIAVLDDRGSEPWVQVVPLWLTQPNGSTRTFGLNEAIAVLAPAIEGARPAPWSAGNRHPRAWIEWYGLALERHLDAITRPSSALLDQIEARRRDQSKSS
jgi:hypothetical protein